MTGRSDRRTLVAGLGNIFLSDDAFGVEVVRRLAGQELPAGTEVVDIGVRGVHLAYQLLDGYDTVVLLDATAQGGRPGTVYLIEHDGQPGPEAPVIDGHRMTPDTVLALLGSLSEGVGGARPRRVVVVGCEPATVEEGMGLSAPVAASVDEAVSVVRQVLAGVEAGAGG